MRSEGRVHRGLGDLEYQLVVDLHDHAHRRPLALKPVVHGDHGALDDVRGGTLHGGIDGGALGTGAAGLVAVVYVRKIQAPTEQGLDIVSRRACSRVRSMKSFTPG